MCSSRRGPCQKGNEKPACDAITSGLPRSYPDTAVLAIGEPFSDAAGRFRHLPPLRKGGPFPGSTTDGNVSVEAQDRLCEMAIYSEHGYSQHRSACLVRSADR
jgi:hypothetical protein